MAGKKIDKNKISEIDKVLISAGFTKSEMKNKQGHEYNAPEGGKINIYNTGTVNFQGKVEITTQLTEFWSENLCQYEAGAPQKNNSNMSLIYRVDRDGVEDVENEIKKLTKEWGIKQKDIVVPHSYFAFVITDDEKRKVTLTQYKTGKLLIQGLNTELLESINDAVGQVLGITFKATVAQAMVKPGEELEVLTVVTKDEQDQASELVNKRMGPCYEFLYEHDQELVDSSEYFLTTGLAPRTYFGCVSGTIKALEGFIKKLVIEIGAFSHQDITARGINGWNFGKIYDPTAKALTTEVTAVLSSEVGVRNQQEQILKRLVQEMFKVRNPSFHDGPPPVKKISTWADARSVHDQIVGLMKSAYSVFEKELSV